MPSTLVLQNSDVKACLSDLQSKYVFVPADKAPNSIIIYVKSIRLRLLLKNWDWIIALLQLETQPIFHVKCHLRALSVLTILS